MKQYVVDELRPRDVEKVRKFLEDNAAPAPLTGLYRLELPQKMLGDDQKGHEECGPHYFSVNLGDSYVRFELLIRCTEKIRCTCIAYATHAQREHIIGYADEMLELLNILV